MYVLSVELCICRLCEHIFVYEHICINMYICICNGRTAEEKHLELNSLTISELKEEMAKVGGPMGEVAKGTKDVKKLAVLRAWFNNDLLPTLKPLELGKKENVKPKVLTAKKKPALMGVKDLQNVKADILDGEIEEEPELLAKILLLTEAWMTLILAGKKTLELRKAKISSGNDPEVYYLAAGKTILARCVISPGVKIENQEDFDMLKGGHQWDKPDPPYTFPFVAHALSRVQKLKALDFERLLGTQGRALYRPVGFAAAAESGKESGTKEEAKTTKKGKTKVTKPKEKATGIKCLPEDALEKHTVEVLDPKAYLQPGEERLARKRKHLKSKETSSQFHISGGLLAHLNNVAFPRAPAETVGFLVGREDAKSEIIVSGIWIPSWESQQNIGNLKIDDADLQDWCVKAHNEASVVGLCLVSPDLDIPDAQKFTVLGNILKDHPPSFAFGLVCKDRKCTVFVDGGDQWQELGIQVHWVGQRSLYVERTVSLHLLALDSLKEEAKNSTQRKRYTKRQKECQQNFQRCMVAPDDKLEGVHITAEQHMETTIEQLQSVADFVVANLPSFDAAANPKIKETFQQCLDNYPLAKLEMSKVMQSMVLETVVAAGQCLSTILQLKSSLQMRSVKRRNASHTFDGFKWAKRQKTGKTPSSMSTSASSKSTKTSMMRSNSFQSTSSGKVSTASRSGGQDLKEIHTYFTCFPVFLM